MRNWNRDQVKKHGGKAYKFISYLWGIETNMDSQYLYIPFYRLHLTYEELKLSHSQSVAEQLPRLHLTYEELKLRPPLPCVRLGRLFISYLWGIETLAVCRACTPSNSVYILPMRNWNNSYSEDTTLADFCLYLTYEELKLGFCWIYVYYKARFISYLWGIET